MSTQIGVCKFHVGKLDYESLKRYFPDWNGSIKEDKEGRYIDIPVFEEQLCNNC